MKKLCVVYLVWEPLSPSYYSRFMDSYFKSEAGVDHDLFLLLNGFDEEHEFADQKTYFLKEKCLDLKAYFDFTKENIGLYRHFLFLNSYSYIRGGSDELNKSPAQGWLKIMYDWITDNRFNVGLVGCTGSWETADNLPSFPNYHIRTNAFMIKGEDFLKCERLVTTKLQCNLFEAGEHSLTRQILAMGKKVLVVGRDRCAMEKESWNRMGTYRQGDQENLLIADNRTDHYQYGDADTRLWLNRLAWGSS